MLTTLEQGVRGGRWHTLIDKVYAPLNLFAAYAKVIGNEGAAGVDHQDGGRLLANRLDENWTAAASTCGRNVSSAGRAASLDSQAGQQGASGRWGFRRCVTAWCKRAVAHVLEPIFERRFRRTQLRLSPRTGVSSRPGTGRGAAECRATRYVVDADLKSYFDTIPNDG